MTLWARFERGGGAEGFGTLTDDGARIDVHTGDMFAAPAAAGEVLEAESVRLLAPVRPRVFAGLWNNFHEAAKKQNLAAPQNPLYFLKSPHCVSDPGAVIHQPHAGAGRIFFEGELAVVIGRQVRHADEARAQASIFGYTAVNDVTAFELLSADTGFAQWARAKSCDTFGPLGPAIATNLDLSTARVRTLVNGRERQNYALADMIFPPAQIVAFLSREMTLYPGDVIACGTSLGALPMRAGQSVEIMIDGLPALRNIYEAAGEEA